MVAPQHGRQSAKRNDRSLECDSVHSLNMARLMRIVKYGDSLMTGGSVEISTRVNRPDLSVNLAIADPEDYPLVACGAGVPAGIVHTVELPVDLGNRMRTIGNRVPGCHPKEDDETAREKYHSAGDIEGNVAPPLRVLPPQSPPVNRPASPSSLFTSPVKKA